MPKLDVSQFAVENINMIEFAPVQEASCEAAAEKFEVLGSSRLFRCVRQVKEPEQQAEEVFAIDELQSCEESELSTDIVQQIIIEENDISPTQRDQDKITSKVKSKKKLISEPSMIQFNEKDQDQFFDDMSGYLSRRMHPVQSNRLNNRTSTQFAMMIKSPNSMFHTYKRSS